MKKLLILIYLILSSISISGTKIYNNDDEFYTEYIKTHNPKISNKDLKEIIYYVNVYSYEYKVPKSLIYATMKVESDFNKNTKSSKNAVGVMQITPVLEKEFKHERYSIKGNIYLGIRYLNKTISQFGLTNNAVAAYNAGIYRIKNKGYDDIKETSNHVKKVKNELKYINDSLYYTKIIK